MLKSIDLALATLALLQMLHGGFPRTIVYSYATLLAVSSLSCVVTILLESRHSAFSEVLVYSTYVRKR